jgi:ribonuclease HII
MIGIDEVGRGAWAGPLLVVAARDIGLLPEGLNDSKVLSKAKREKIMPLIQQSCDLGEGWVTAKEVDTIGLTAAMELAVSRALQALSALPHEQIIMDGHINYCSSDYTNVTAVIDADASYPIVSAASIYAKVIRDNHMTELAQTIPGYGFEKHVGYGTKLHMEGLARLGVSQVHRLSYKPVAKFV